jgi:hypothetical protein
MRSLAHHAEEASREAVSKLARGTVKHEDDLTGVLAGMIESRINHLRIGGVIWDTAILTHRRSGEEAEYGADMLVHVYLDTPKFKYSRGVLVQASIFTDNLRSRYRLSLQRSHRTIARY